MKRSEPLKRKTPLKAKSKPKRQRRPLTVPERDLAGAWQSGIGSRCAVCGNRYRRDCDAHHIIRVQVLKREATRLGYDFERVRWDRRNRLPVCRVCHERHHSRWRPIKREVLLRHAAKVFPFARELGLEHVLEREYPQVAVSARTGDAAPA